MYQIRYTTNQVSFYLRWIGTIIKHCKVDLQTLMTRTVDLWLFHIHMLLWNDWFISIDCFFIFNFFIAIYFVITCSICICFYRINWLYFLLSFSLNATLLTSSVNTISFLRLNLCCDFNINLFFFTNWLWFSTPFCSCR